MAELRYPTGAADGEISSASNRGPGGGAWLRARSLPIGVKLFVLVSAVVIGLVTFLTTYFASRRVALLERNVVEKGDFVAQQLRTAVAFADKETAREVFEAAHNAREVLHLALFASDGKLLFADGNGPWRRRRQPRRRGSTSSAADCAWWPRSLG